MIEKLEDGLMLSLTSNFLFMFYLMTGSQTERALRKLQSDAGRVRRIRYHAGVCILYNWQHVVLHVFVSLLEWQAGRQLFCASVSVHAVSICGVRDRHLYRTCRAVPSHFGDVSLGV